MTATVDAVAAERALSLTPTVGGMLKRVRFWIVVVLVVALAVVAVQLLNGSTRDLTPFGPANASPNGARALVEVLRAQGVDVKVATNLEEAVADAGDPAKTTLLLHDSALILDADRLDELEGIAAHLVLVAPDATALDRFAPGVALAGTPDADGAVPAACDVPAAVRAGSASAADASVQAAGDAASGGTAFCFTDAGGRALVAVGPGTSPDTTVTVVAGTTPFENEGITSAGNAALALGLLGQSPTLVWYQPGFDDIIPGTVPPSRAELTPEWVTPLLLLLLAVGLAAAIWRGRRLGPLVVENLPVVVRAGETIEGRARLYRRSSDRLHALDALRIGAVTRLARLLGLPSMASVDDICVATAQRLGRPEAEIRALLVDDVPGSDATLIAAGQALADLEQRVTATLAER